MPGIKPKGYKSTWLTVGQRVRIRASQNKGTITAVDKRFKHPYSVSIDGLVGKKKHIQHFAANELAIAR